MRFAKLQGTGNDYVFLNCVQGTPENLPELARRLSRPHFGVGADGLICVCPSRRADVAMRIFNADGSEGEMCGNGIRCLGKFVYDTGLVRRPRLRVETRAGVRELSLTIKEGQVVSVTADMGRPGWGRLLELADGERARPVSMGNPHLVLLRDSLEGLDLTELGPWLERHPAFPRRTNVEVAAPIPGGLRMRVWERGSGETLSCGTGACAALVAAVLAGLSPRQARVEVPGGALEVDWEGERVRLTGPAVTVFEGELPPEME